MTIKEQIDKALVEFGEYSINFTEIVMSMESLLELSLEIGVSLKKYKGLKVSWDDKMPTGQWLIR